MTDRYLYSYCRRKKNAFRTRGVLYSFANFQYIENSPCIPARIRLNMPGPTEL